MKASISESEVHCWVCYHHKGCRHLGAAPATPGLWKEGTCPPEIFFQCGTSLEEQTLFRKYPLGKLLWGLWVPFGVALMKDSLPSFVSHTLILSPSLLPRRIQLQRQTGNQPQSATAGCAVGFWGISLYFSLLLCKASIFPDSGGVCKTRWCPWNALHSLTPLERMECCYSNPRSCWPWLLHMTKPPFFFLAAKINALRTVHSLLPFLQIPFYSESFLQVKWSNCKRFLCIQWVPQSERKPAKVSPQQTPLPQLSYYRRLFPITSSEH